MDILINIIMKYPLGIISKIVLLNISKNMTIIVGILKYKL